VGRKQYKDSANSDYSDAEEGEEEGGSTAGKRSIKANCTDVSIEAEQNPEP
jgi:hypothetical protein